MTKVKMTVKLWPPKPDPIPAPPVWPVEVRAGYDADDAEQRRTVIKAALVVVGALIMCVVILTALQIAGG